MRWAVLLLAGTGCSQLFGLEAPTRGDHVEDAALGDAVLHDTAPDGPPPRSCIEAWMSSAGPAFGPITSLSFNATNDDYAPSVTSDGLEIEFSRNGEVYQGTRNATTDNFTNINRVGSLSSPSVEGKAWLAQNRLRATVSSNRGSTGGYDLFRGSRGSVAQSFSIDQTYLDNVNTATDEIDPDVSDDLLHLYLAINPSGTFHIAFASRPTTADNFSTPVVISEILAPLGTAADTGPALTADERVIVFVSTRGGSADFYYATRASASASFGAVKALAALSSTAVDSTPSISDDGCTVYFASDRTIAGDADIFQATVALP